MLVVIGGNLSSFPETLGQEFGDLHLKAHGKKSQPAKAAVIAFLQGSLYINIPSGKLT